MSSAGREGEEEGTKRLALGALEEGFFCCRTEDASEGALGATGGRTGEFAEEEDAEELWAAEATAGLAFFACGSDEGSNRCGYQKLATSVHRFREPALLSLLKQANSF